MHIIHKSKKQTNTDLLNINLNQVYILETEDFFIVENNKQNYNDGLPNPDFFYNGEFYTYFKILFKKSDYDLNKVKSTLKDEVIFFDNSLNQVGFYTCSDNGYSKVEKNIDDILFFSQINNKNNIEACMPYLKDYAKSNRFEKCNADFKDAYNSDKVSQDMADLMIETIMWQWEADSNVTQAPIAAISLLNPIKEIWEFESEVSKNECLIKEHEVFVKDSGWVSIADVKIGDIILTYDTETRTTKFDVVKDTIKKMYNDDLIMIKNNRNHFKQVVTKGHRMVTKRLYSTNESKLNSIEIYEANNCPTNGSMAFITSGEKEGNISLLCYNDFIETKHIKKD